MSQFTHKLVDGEVISLTPEEIAKLEAEAFNLSQKQKDLPAVTKELLLRRLEVIQAEIQNLS